MSTGVPGDRRSFGEATPADIRNRVLVPVLEAEDAPRALEVGADLARQRNAELIAVNPVTYPEQTPMRLPRERTDEQRRLIQQLVDEQFADSDLATKATIRVGRKVPVAVANAAEEYGADLLVLDHSGNGRFRSVTGRIRTRVGCDTAVLNGDPLDGVSSVLLAVAGGPHSSAAAHLARDVAAANDAWVDVFHAVPPDATAERQGRGHRALVAATDRLGEFEDADTWLYESDDAVGAIIEQSRYYDLTVVGAPRKSRLRQFVTGSTARDVREGVDSTVLVARHGDGRTRGLFR